MFSSDQCLAHDPGRGHPEQPARLLVLRDRLAQHPDILLYHADPAPTAALLAVHPSAYLESLAELSRQGGGALDPDTTMNAGSWGAALVAAGAVLQAVNYAHEGFGHAFAAIRPPGHHALAARAMGFCFLANVVIGVRAAQARGRDRVLIVDWDVHHGNGTQSLVEHDPSIRFISLHEWPAYPGTGAGSERGVGNVFNVPRPAALPPETYVEDLWAAVVAATTDWAPEMVFISAGFDAMAGDPLGGFTLEPEHYATWSWRLRERFPDTPIVGALEGGYVPSRLADGVMAHLTALS